MLVFAAGFAGGLLLWLALPTCGDWKDIRTPFWSTLVLFAVHRVEGEQSGFFAMLSKVTGVPAPEVTTAAVIALVVLYVGG